MMSPQVAGGGQVLQVQRAAANILNKQSQAFDMWSLQLGYWVEANNSII
jgi:hypothetical protein